MRNQDRTAASHLGNLRLAEALESWELPTVIDSRKLDTFEIQVHTQAREKKRENQAMITQTTHREDLGLIAYTGS
jgi:hypothetical protein